MCRQRMKYLFEIMKVKILNWLLYKLGWYKLGDRRQNKDGSYSIFVKWVKSKGEKNEQYRNTR